MNATQITPNSTGLEMNTGYKATTEDEVLGPEIILFYAIFLATQATVAITGNAITIAVVLKYDFLRELSTSTMVAGLALADIFSEVAPLCGPVARQFTSKPSALMQHAPDGSFDSRCISNLSLLHWFDNSTQNYNFELS